MFIVNITVVDGAFTRLLPEGTPVRACLLMSFVDLLGFLRPTSDLFLVSLCGCQFVASISSLHRFSTTHHLLRWAALFGGQGEHDSCKDELRSCSSPLAVSTGVPMELVELTQLTRG